MKLIFIYGPPASGKLTVANELSKLTSYKVFHNHLTTDLVKSIFVRNTEPYIYYINKYRLELIEAAAKYNINCIFTYVYEQDIDDWFVKKAIDLVEKNNGEVLFVKLTCPLEELKKRVKNSSRKRFTKITKVKILADSLKNHNFTGVVPHKKSLIVNNSRLSAKKVARLILQHYNL